MDGKIKARIEQLVYDTLGKGNAQFGSSAVINRIYFQSNMTNTYGKAGFVRDGDGRLTLYLRFSVPYIDHDLDHIINDTIPHEVAHIIAVWLKFNKKRFGDLGHGAGWQTIAKALGADPTQQKHSDKRLNGGARYEYETEAGNTLYLSQDEHDKIQKDYKVLRDKQGNRITKFIKQVK